MRDALLFVLVAGTMIIAMIVDVMAVVGWLRRQTPGRNR
jgi:hypothetical protein